MRILQVIHQYLPHHRAGSELYTHSLARELARRHEVMVYCHEAALDGSGMSFVVDSYDGVPVRRIASWLEKTPPPPWTLFEHNYHNALIEADYTNFIEQFRPDIVHVQHLKDLSVSLLGATARRGIPIVMTLHDYWAICPNAQFVRPGAVICNGTHAQVECGFCAAERLRSRALRWVAPLMAPLFWARRRAIRTQMRYVQRFIAPSEFLRRHYIAEGFAPDRILQLENGLDLRRIAPATVAPRSAFRGHYAFIGSLAWQKGAHVAVEAFRALGDAGAQLRLWGNPQAFPDYVRNLQERAAGCSWIRFEGEADDAQIAQALAWADYLLVPSLWWENSPVTVQEAYAAGVPVIASRLGALPEKVRDGRSGLLFRPGDAQDLAQVIRRTLDEPNLWEALRAGLPQPVDMPAHAACIERLYEEALATPRSRPMGR